MTATIKNLFTRLQFIFLASLLALVFLYVPNAQAATSNIDLSVTPSDSSIEWIGEKGVTYSFYVDGSKIETRLKEGKSLFATLGMKRGTFTLSPGAHTVTAVGKDAKGVVVSTSAPTAFFAGFEVPKPKVGVPTGKSSSRNTYPFMAKAVSSTQVDLIFNCAVPNANYSCKIYQDGKLIKSFDVKKSDYGRYTAYSVKNLTPNTKYSFVVVEYAKKGSLPDKPLTDRYTYTPTLTLKTPSTAVVVPPTTPSMKVISPNGKETYKTGDVMTIKWNTGDTTKIKNVRISLLYKENDPSDTRLFEGTVVESVPNTGSYTWKIGERYARGMQKGEFSIGVGKAETNYIAVDYSDDSFTINPGTTQTKLTVTSPKKGQIVKNNEEMLITWNVERDAGVRADLFRTSDEGFMRNLDVRGTGAKEGLFAKLPQDIGAKDDYYVRVSQGDEEIGYSEPFSITAPVSCMAIECTEKLTLKSSNEDPDATTIVLSNEDTLIEVPIFAFDLSAVDSSDDIDLGTIAITVTVGGVKSINELVKSFRLEVDGESRRPERYVGTARSEKIIFDIDHDETVKAGRTNTLVLYTNFKNLSSVTEKTIITASVSPTDIMAEGVKNVVVGGATQNGATHTIARSGLQLGDVVDGTGSADSTQVVSGVSTDLNYGTMFLEYEITPFGDDMFVKANSASRGSSKTAGVSYVIEDANGNVIPTGTSSVSYDIEGADDDDGYFHLEEGESYTMIVTVNSYNPIPTGTYRLQVLSVGSSPIAGGVVSQDAPSDPSDYESDDVVIQSNTPATPPKTPSTPSANDTTPPTTPGNFRVTASTTTSVTLLWNASTDVWGVKGYNIYRDTSTTPRNTTLITSTNFTDTGLTQGTGYKYAVEAVDVTGNKSVKATVSTNTPTPVTAIIPQVIPTCTLTANKSSYVLGETITYSWTSKNATYAGWQQDTSGKDHLLLPGDKLPANGTQAVPASVTGNPSVTLTVGGAGTGSCSLTVAVTSPTPAVTIDKTVPTVPASATIANVAAIAGSGWSVDLSWGASTDNVGVTGYIVKRLAPTASTLTTTTGKTYKLTDLVLTTEYTVSIQAKDARGNLGPARVVKFKLNFVSMGLPPTVQIISNTVDTAVQKVVAQAPNQTPLTSAEQSTKIETLTSLMNKLIELKAMMASVKMSR